ncbi:hypothetical protein GF323_05205 [Candidatus Woesearchaeota archaeon]|nr:hypothetical protein [Candidatus Woesearchaeota archaeon]
MKLTRILLSEEGGIKQTFNAVDSYLLSKGNLSDVIYISREQAPADGQLPGIARHVTGKNFPIIL